MSCLDNRNLSCIGAFHLNYNIDLRKTGSASCKCPSPKVSLTMYILWYCNKCIHSVRLPWPSEMQCLGTRLFGLCLPLNHEGGGQGRQRFLVLFAANAMVFQNYIYVIAQKMQFSLEYTVWEMHFLDCLFLYPSTSN